MEHKNAQPISVSSKLSPSEQLAYSTTRISCVRNDGSKSVGTGFFFNFLEEGTKSFPVIVTNKHVVKGAVSSNFVLTCASALGEPTPGIRINIEITRTQVTWVNHPDASVDLCVLPIGPIVNIAMQQGHRFFYRALNKDLLPTSEDLAGLTALEEILMIGYPIGIWDSVNNMPILRKGVTATHPNMDYEGRLEFLIDAACFPGSSGSPVLLFNTGSWADREGRFVVGGQRIKLLGIMYAGPQYDAKGEIRVETIPTHQRPIAVSSIPINLGVVIKAQKLLDFEPILRAKAVQ